MSAIVQRILKFALGGMTYLLGGNSMVQQRTIIVALAIVILLIGVSVLVLSTRKGPSTMTTTPSITQTTKPTTPTTTTPTQISPTTTTTTQTQTKTETKTTTPSPTPTPTQTKTPACAKPVKLIVLTRHPGDILDKAKEAFLKSDVAKKYCIEDIVYVALPPGFWVQRIKSSSVDVGWGGGPTLFDNLYYAGVLRPLQTQYALEAAKQVPDVFAGMPLKRIGQNGEIYWVSAAIASFGFTINKDVAEQLGFDISKLKTWRDLASDDLGLILVNYGVPPLRIANPLMSTSNTRMYEIILQAYGWEEGWRILTLMAANAQVLEGSADVRDAVINGEALVGITIDFYGYTAERLNPACMYVLPEGESIVNGDPIAITASTKNLEAAEAFLAWVLTEGQAVWLHPDINRLPANPRIFDMPVKRLAEIAGVDVDTMKAQVELLKKKYEQIKTAKTIHFNDTLALLTETVMQYYFVATLVELHDLLQEAWTKLLTAYYIDKTIDKTTFEQLKSKLTEVVTYKDPVTGQEVKFTLKDALRVNKVIKEALSKGDTTLIDKYKNAWRAAARAKYEEVLKALGG